MPDLSVRIQSKSRILYYTNTPINSQRYSYMKTERRMAVNLGPELTGDVASLCTVHITYQTAQARLRSSEVRSAETLDQKTKHRCLTT